MEQALPIILILAMVLTVGVLGFGLVGMVRGRGERSLSHNERANKLMRLRVVLQCVALVLFAALFLFAKH